MTEKQALEKKPRFRMKLQVPQKWREKWQASEVEEKTFTFRENTYLRLRMIPLWLRFVGVFIALLLIAVIGLMIGFSVVGDGKVWDVFRPSTWTHIVDIMRGVEAKKE